jgi:nicotinamidase-related amidase
MCLQNITAQLPVPSDVAIVGIESHVCVLQTTLDLLKAGHAVYVISDGVSSCNKEEIPIALARMRQAGAFITTSESFVYLPVACTDIG